MQLTVELVQNLVQQKIAILAGRAWELYDREGVDFDEPDKAFCEFTRLHAMDELLYYRSEELTYPQLEEFYASALQSGGYDEVPFLPFDFSFLNTPVYVEPATPNTGITLPITASDVLVDITGITELLGSLQAGDFSGTLQQLLDLMLKRYGKPVIATFSHNKPATLEVGQKISDTIVFSWNINNPQNVGNTPSSGNLSASEAGLITPTGAFNLFGTTGKTVTLVADYTKNTVGTLLFYLRGKDSNGDNIPQVSSSIHWNTRIMVGNNVSPTVETAQVTAFTPISASTRYVSGTIIGAGYKYIFVPNMLDQAGIGFKDPVNGNIDIDVIVQGEITIVNAQGLEITGRLYRTKNSLGSNLTFNIV